MLRNIIMRWLGFTRAEVHSESMLSHMSNDHNKGTFTVTPIVNGFLVIERTYNPSGPDTLRAVHAPDLTSLSGVLVSVLTAQKLKP